MPMRKTARELAEEIGAAEEGDGPFGRKGAPAAGRAAPGHPVREMAVAKAAAGVVERTPIAAGIHPTAIVAPLARIAPGVGIGPYAVIGEDVHVGEGTQIGPHCVVAAGCWIGQNSR